MKAQLLKVQKQPSKYKGYFHYLFFKGEDGKSYRSCVGDAYRNWVNWRDIIANFDESEPLWLDGLKLKGSLIDADSKPVKVKDE
jgi:hypothetical protein